MIATELKKLRDYIIDPNHNGYFTKGYDDARKYADAGISIGQEIIFPTDNLGDIFYLRPDTSANVDSGSYFQISDSTRGVGLVSVVTLVAFVRNASPVRLAQNLMNTMQYYNGLVGLLAVETNPYAVLASELDDMDDDAINQAFATFDERNALVSIRFTLTAKIPLQDPTCNLNPCKSC